MFSVIILTHQTPTFLANCLKSIRSANGNKVHEVIIVNDGGPDEIGKIAESFEKQLPVKYIKNPSNKGISYSRNAGILASGGEYITIFADNYTVHPDHFLMVEKYLQDYDTVASNVRTIGGGIGSSTLNHYYQYVIREWTRSAKKVDGGFTGGNFPAGAASSFRRRVIGQTGLFDTSLRSSEDTDYNRRIDDHKFNRLYAEQLIVCRTETDSFFTILKKQYQYGNTVFRFREKNNEQHFIKYEIKHALYIIFDYLRTTKNIVYFPLIAMFHSALRMGIIMGILKKRMGKGSR